MSLYFTDNIEGTWCWMKTGRCAQNKRMHKNICCLHMLRASRNTLDFWIIVALNSKWVGGLLPAMLWHMLKVCNAALSTLWFIIDGAIARDCFHGAVSLFLTIGGSLLSALFPFIAKRNRGSPSTGGKSGQKCKCQTKQRLLFAYQTLRLLRLTLSHWLA